MSGFYGNLVTVQTHLKNMLIFFGSYQYIVHFFHDHLFHRQNDGIKFRWNSHFPGFSGIMVAGKQGRDFPWAEITQNGRGQNSGTKGRNAKKGKILLNRLEKYKENHLLILHDFHVHYSNNMSEKDQRICKNRQKIAGDFVWQRDGECTAGS